MMAILKKHELKNIVLLCLRLIWEVFDLTVDIVDETVPLTDFFVQRFDLRIGQPCVFLHFGNSVPRETI